MGARGARVGVCLLASLGLLGCPSSTPRQIRDGGTQVSLLALEKEKLLSGTSRIFELRAVGSEILVVASEGAVRLDRSGRPLSSIPLLPEAVRNPVASGPLAASARPAFAAHAFDQGELVLYGRDGQRYASAPLDFNYAQRLLIANLSGDGDGEVVVAPAGAKHVEVYGPEGHLLRRPRSPFYVTAVDACAPEAGAEEELVVYVYPNETGGGTFSFLDGRGEARREWEYEAVSGFDAVCGSGEDVLVTQEDGSYRVLSLEGQELERLEAPLGDFFADVHAVRWRGGWVVVASGSGYRPYHMVSVFDRTRELVYQETGDGWSRSALIPDPDGDWFLVAVGSQLWRYSLAGGAVGH